MREVKREFRWFSITEYEKEAEYLRYRHKEGWKFKKVTFPGIYTFERCTPQDVVYQLDYNPDGVKEQEEYIQMFEDCGWEYLMNFAGYTYFRKPATSMEKEENIFCDDQSRLELLNRIFRGRIIPLMLIFVTMLLNGFLNMDNTAMTIFFAILTGIYVLVFLQFAVKYVSFRNRLVKK